MSSSGNIRFYVILSCTNYILCYYSWKGVGSLVLFLFSDYRYVFAFKDPGAHWLHLDCAIRQSKLLAFVGWCNKALVLPARQWIMTEF